MQGKLEYIGKAKFYSHTSEMTEFNIAIYKNN